MIFKYKYINEFYDGRVIEGWFDIFVFVWGVLFFEGIIFIFFVFIGLVRYRNGGSFRFFVEFYFVC